MSQSDSRLRPGWILIGLATALTLVDFALSFIKGVFEAGGAGGISYGIGAGMAPIVLALVVVGFFQIGKSFRTRRSRIKVYTWSLAVFLIITLIQLAQTVVLAGAR